MGMIAPNPPRIPSLPPVMRSTKHMQPQEKLSAEREYKLALERWKAECEELEKQEDDDFETLGQWTWGMALVVSATILLSIAIGLAWAWLIWDMFGVKGYIVLAVAGIAVFELANFLRKKL